MAARTLVIGAPRRNSVELANLRDRAVSPMSSAMIRDSLWMSGSSRCASAMTRIRTAGHDGMSTVLITCCTSSCDRNGAVSDTPGRELSTGDESPGPAVLASDRRRGTA
jgi:hypothetical protein